jgi:hypothetical protein
MAARLTAGVKNIPPDKTGGIVLVYPAYVNRP